MGAVSRDIDKRFRQYEDKYPYAAEGISQLMRDYSKLKGGQALSGDVDSVALLADLEYALDNCNLTPRMRQALALYYFAELSKVDVAKVLGVNRKSFDDTLDAAVERLEAFMEFGYNKAVNIRNDAIIHGELRIYSWANDIARGYVSVYSKPEGVTEWLAQNGDKKAKESRNKTNNFVLDYEGVEEYPPYTKEQFRWNDRRMSFAAEVFPSGDVIGTRKVCVKLKDDPQGREYMLERRKMFARGSTN